MDGQKPKPAKEIHIGQTLIIRRGEEVFEVIVDALSEHRGPAPVAQCLYSETDASIESRQGEKARRQMERAGLRIPDTRPSKKQRRDLRRLKEQTED